MWTVERFPQLRPALWRSFYRALAAYSRRAEYWTFMNYGYVDENPESRPELAPEDQEERYPIYRLPSRRGAGRSPRAAFFAARLEPAHALARQIVELARLWRDARPAAELRALLEPLIAAIRGGDETRDVRDARAFLAELA